MKNLKLFGGVQVMILIFIIIIVISVISVGSGGNDYCRINAGDCEWVINASSILSLTDPNIVVWKLSNDSSVSAGEKFTFWIWVYNFGNGSATIDVRDYLDECFIFLNQSMVFFNGTSENPFMTYSFSRSNGNLTWSNMFVPGKGNANYTYFKIFLNVSAGNCHGNFTNFVRVNGTNQNNLPLGYLCELCRGNYTQKCVDICTNNNCVAGNRCMNETYTNTSDCIGRCESLINISNYINSNLRANTTVEIISLKRIELNLSKSAPLNTTYGEIIQFNISWGVVHPFGNATNITIIDYLPPQVSFVNCSNNCSYSNGNVRWNFMNVVNGSRGVVYLNVSVVSLTGNILNRVEIRGKSRDMIGNRFASSSTEILSGPISGKIFKDANSNGILEDGEEGLNTTIYISGVTIRRNPYSVIIDPAIIINGTFNVTVPYGTYNITAAPIPNMINTTSLTIYNVVVRSPEGSTGNKFGFYAPIGICPPVNLSCYPNANITILIDGINSTTFNYSGKPYNITVYAKDANGNPIQNAIIRIWEWNGHNPFALSQFASDGSNVTNYAVAEVKTDSNGFATFTIVPTGGILGQEDKIGPYNITVGLYADCSSGPIFLKAYEVIDRLLPARFYRIKIPNYIDVQASKEYVLRVYVRIKRWLGLGGGETRNLIIYTNGAIEGLNFNLTSGKPTGLNITVKYPNGTLASNVTVRITEKNGHCPFALSQFGHAGSNVTNYMISEVRTDSNGNARFTIVPTGGIMDQEDKIGEYWIRINVITDPSYIDCRSNFFISPVNVSMFVLDRNLPFPKHPAYDIPNELNVEASKEFILRVYARIKRWLF